MGSLSDVVPQDSHSAMPPLKTQILPVDVSSIIAKPLRTSAHSLVDGWTLECPQSSTSFRNLQKAAGEILTTDFPVAFPTETVYGLGADATRSAAVQGIYKAKQRPSDNPLIVHVHSLEQVRRLLRPVEDDFHHKDVNGNATAQQPGILSNGTSSNAGNKHSDPIPSIYKPLIDKFWPGPLTLIMPNHPQSKLAHEVTAGLSTFGVRMPRSLHALALIKLVGVPLAAPSANASTKPSPTSAEHVYHDLNGRISTIIDGGPCEVGLESTVVDGLCSPPAILRPGGVSIEELRQCSGWENVVVGYKDATESTAGPRAPGMKYRHYSPKATVLLLEYPAPLPSMAQVKAQYGSIIRLGIIRSARWSLAEVSASLQVKVLVQQDFIESNLPLHGHDGENSARATINMTEISALVPRHSTLSGSPHGVTDLWDIHLGGDPEIVARRLFAALRELDKKDVDLILVEGIDDAQGDVATAVMNRLRKAAAAPSQ